MEKLFKKRKKMASWNNIKALNLILNLIQEHVRSHPDENLPEENHPDENLSDENLPDEIPRNENKSDTELEKVKTSKLHFKKIVFFS